MFQIPAWEEDDPSDIVEFEQKKEKTQKSKTESVQKIKHTKLNKLEEKNIPATNGTTKEHKLDNKPVTKTRNKKEINKDLETDELLINAKRKKFNEIIENDDMEIQVLFNESNKHKKNKNLVNDSNANTNVKQDNNANIMNGSRKKFNKIIENDNMEIPLLFNESNEHKHKKNKNLLNDSNANTNVKENNNANIMNGKRTRKDKLRAMLNKHSNRNPINISSTSNKLRQRMLERLKAAQFRYLNEKLYTSSGSQSKDLFQNDPTAFQTYHQGYQQQIKKWPVNPLDVIVKKILKMPKTHTIADLGCGEAALSKRVPHTVRSFDLVAAAPGVEACDMAHTPLLAAAVDVAVYCLALMGTELTQYLLEANRILKMGGHLLIAEVESRFDKVENFTGQVERLGFRLKQLDNDQNVFYFMEFVKIREPPAKKSKLPALTLKPCLYKRR